MSYQKTPNLCHDALCQALELWLTVCVSTTKPIVYKCNVTGLQKKLYLSDVIYISSYYASDSKYQSDLLLKDIEGTFWHFEVINTNELSKEKLQFIKERGFNVLKIDLSNVVKKNTRDKLQDATIQALKGAVFTQI